MRSLIYDIAVSIDGFIAGPNHDISTFLYEGEHATDYVARLQHYTTVVMGRSTYTSGYAFGLQPGQRAYPHMEHIIFSRSLELPEERDVQLVREDAVEVVRTLKEQEGGDIYLCGGGELAGHLHRAGLIDRLILKINPITLGAGRPLFGNHPTSMRMHLLDQTLHTNGVIVAHYTAHPPASD
ncbi:MAG: dihydrofolate reductase family protein [Myxococcota bacterium]